MQIGERSKRTVIHSISCIAYRIGGVTKITLKQKIESAYTMAGMTQTEFAKRMGMSQQTFSSRLKVGKFTQEELEKMASIVGAEWKSGFYFHNGNRIE